MVFSKKYGQYIFVILSGIIYYHVGYQLVRSNFEILIFDVSLLFALYIYAYKYLTFDWFSVIILRIVLLASIPSLSDDYFRFIWDGNLLANGQNPYQFLPSELVQNSMYKFQAIEVYEGMNSKNYYSVYPPLLQMIFGFSAWVADGNILINIITLRIVIILTDLGVIYLIIKLLKIFNIDNNQAKLYALNPLVILELTGNLHFEAVTLFFLLLAFYILLTKSNSHKNILLSATALAAGTIVKLIPLIFITLIINKIGLKKGVMFSSIVGIIVVISFLPFINISIISNISQSLNLYFQHFEFNASIYYLVRWLGIFINNNNPIQLAGPLLSLISLSLILWISFKEIIIKNLYNQFIIKALLIISIYFFFATTVHPWYLTTLVALACLTQFRFAIVWSALAFLSYSAYKLESYNENLWFISFEYFIVFGFLYYELKTKKLNSY